ncbi:hypothetical protein WBG06_21315 [Nocardioides sp. CCNWLW239]|uniref:hypothetical protein n=1 Tax=Nocardioides sp. CCNWLW239 TaxID=3128902 RepID=UPI003015B6B3
MSNYLVVAMARHLRPRIDDWLRTNKVTRTEYRFVPVETGFILLMGRDVARSVGPRNFLRGTVVSEDGTAIGYGLPAWSLARTGRTRITGGEYVAATWSLREAEVWTDTFGTVPLLHTAGPGIVAASDSLLVLADLRAHLGLPNSVDLEVVAARSRTLAITSQMISSDTLYSEIERCPVGKRLRIMFGGVLPTSAVVGVDAFHAFSPVGLGYRDVIRRASAVAVGQVRAISSIDGYVPMLSLTGGYDSRAVLAAASRAGVSKSLFIESHRRTDANVADYEAAVGLARSLGLDINHPANFDFGAPDVYGAPLGAVWASSHLGVYDRLVPTRSSNGKPRSIPMNGLGAEMAKGGYGWRSAEQTTAYYGTTRRDSSAYAGARRDAFAHQFRKGLRELGVPDDHPWASEWHYLGHRNGLHSGAHLAISLIGLRPLTQAILARYALHPRPGSDGPRPTGAALVQDILSVTDADMTSLPYETPERAISSTYAVERQDALGGPLLDEEIPDVTVWGTPGDAVSGPMSFGLGIANRWGYDFDLGPDQIVDQGRDWVAGISDPATRGIYTELLDLSSKEMQKWRPADAGPGPAKLLTARLLV